MPLASYDSATANSVGHDALPYVVVSLAVVGLLVWTVFATDTVIAGSLGHALFGNALSAAIVCALAFAGIAVELPTVLRAHGGGIGGLTADQTAVALGAGVALAGYVAILNRQRAARRRLRRRGFR